MSSELCARDLRSKRLLGKGLASVGYETELKGERFARLDFIGVPSSTFRKEATVVAGLKHHKNVVRAHDWVVDKTSCSLVLEYMENDLLGLMQKRKESQGSKPSRSQPFELPEALDIILQIARGMESLHEQNIVHGDLKTKNILVACRKEEERDASLVVKVADYGLVRTKRKSMSFVSRQARKLDVVRWKAPETLEKVLSEYTDETSSQSDSDSGDECVGASGSGLLSGDVYSFAMTCFQILTGEDPYPNLNWKKLGGRIVSDSLRPKLPPAGPPLLNSLLALCWSKVPAQRPDFSIICETMEQILHKFQTPTAEDIQFISSTAMKKVLEIRIPSEDAVTLLQEPDLELGDKETSSSEGVTTLVEDTKESSSSDGVTTLVENAKEVSLSRESTISSTCGRLERTLNKFPPLDHGSTLLGGGHSQRGGRKVIGGIMMRPGYRGPTVNIRPPKWTDKPFWIRTDNYNDARYIADAVYYHIGREPFHYTDMTFQYPPLRLATRELCTREACAVYVESIAKGPAHQKQREVYRDLVKELVLKAVKSPEAVLFLSSLRPSTSSDGAAVESDANEGGGAEEDVADFGKNVGDELADQVTSMDVDPVSVQVLSEPVLAASGYIPSFGIASASLDPLWFASGTLPTSDHVRAATNKFDSHPGCELRWQGKQAEENASFDNLDGLLSRLDKEEAAALESCDKSAWVQGGSQINP